MVDDRQVLRELVDRRPRETADPRNHPQHQEHGKRHHAGHDLVFREARNEETQRNEAAAQQQQPDVGGENRLPFRVPVDEQERKVHERDGEHDHVQRDGAEKLAHDDLKIGDRRRQQELDGARALLFGVRPHRHHRHEEQDENGDVLQQRTNELLVHVHGLRSLHLHHLHALAHEEPENGDEKIAVEQRPETDDDVCDRRREVGFQLFLCDGDDVTHGRLLLRAPRRRRRPPAATRGPR